HETTGILCALIARHAFTEMSDLMTLSVSEATHPGEKEAPPGLLSAVSASFALALIQTAREAIEANHAARAMAALSALACLDVPAQVRHSLHDLRAIKGIPDEVRTLVDVNERLVKESDTPNNSLEGVVAAVHALADAFA